MIKGFIKDCDNLRIEASLYYNKNDKIVKSIFGGLLSIIIMMLILSGGSYFFHQFISRENFTLVSNSAVKSDINYKDFSKIPFMTRLSGRHFNLYPEGYYYTKLRLFNTKLGSSSQTFKDYQLEPCDINKGELATKKEIFSAIEDINTYLCPVYNGDNFELRGIYGSTDYSFGLLHFYFCVNDEKVGRTNCADFDEIKKAFGGTFVDFITISNSINHYDSVPYQEQIYKARIPSSSTIFKRIWLYYQRTIYKTDYGYIFESIHYDTIFSIKEYSADIDLREFKDNFFLGLTFVNHENTITYTKSYMKAPTLLANIGGIIRWLTLIGYILNYPIAVNLFKLSLINTIYDKENSYGKIEQISSYPYSTTERFEIENKKLNKNTENKNKQINANNQSINYGDTINNNLISIQNMQNASKSVNKNNLNILNNNYIDYNINKNNIHDNLREMIRKNSNNTNNDIKFFQNVAKNSITINKPNIMNDNNRKNPIKKTLNNRNSSLGRMTTENTKTVLTRNIFKLSFLNMLDPFQIYLNKTKKEQYIRRLKQAEECLNINNLITNFKELSLIKSILFEENQLILLDNLNKLDPDLNKMTIAYNNIMTKEHQLKKFINKDTNKDNNKEQNDEIEDNKYSKSYINYDNNKTLEERNLNSKLINLVDF